MYGILVIPLVFIFGVWLGSILTAKLIYKDFKENYFVEEKVIVKQRHPSSQNEPYFYNQEVEEEFDDLVRRFNKK
jgi:hypothetical protein